MASIQKRLRANGSTHYVVKWKDRNGTHRTKGGFNTKKGAADYAATEVEPKRRRGVVFDPNAGKLAFRDAAASWLASRHDLKATTLAAYRDALAPTVAATATRHKPLADLRIDAVFGGCPMNAITREDISEWVARMVAAGKKPSTARNAYSLVRMILGQAVEDGRLDANPADYVKLPTEYNAGTGSGMVDDPAQFLTAAQVAALVAATPWPCNVIVHLAAWAGLRAAELAGLQVGDVSVSERSLNPNAPAKPGVLHVERTIARIDGELTYITPKTTGSRRRVPLTAATTALLRDYLNRHPRRTDATAPLFPAMVLRAPRPTGVRATPANGVPASAGGSTAALRQASGLAELTVAEAEARLQLDWSRTVRHASFYKAVYRPSVLRANRMVPTAKLLPELKFHSLRHTYASLCVAAGIPPMHISRFMGHAHVGTTLGIYVHLFEDDHSEAMSALGGMSRPVADASNVIPLRG